jgi:capsular exopolysaccharide synthesis family protein
VADRAIRFWYLVVLSAIITLTAAFLLNRYSEPIYPIKASIIIKESEENAGAKFLYDNELITPYRNFYNELYIMKSYPLLEEVMKELGFEVSLFREGDIKTTEYYNREFPIDFEVVPTHKTPFGKSFYFTLESESTYSLQFESEREGVPGKNYTSLALNDTVPMVGFNFIAICKKPVRDFVGKTFTVTFNNTFNLARAYSGRLNATWAQQGASVVNLEVTGTVVEKEIDFLNKFIERYQLYDIEKKNKMATMAIGFLDDQLVHIGDSLKRYENEVEQFKRRNIITGLGEETNRLYLKMQGFEDQKFQYRLVENYFVYIDELLEDNQFDGMFTPASVGITDPVITDLVTSLIEEQTQVNLYKENSTRGAELLNDNPALRAKLQKIELIKRDILKTIENTRKTRQINLRFINDQIKLVEDQLAKLPSSEREFIQLQRNYSLKEKLYIYLLQKRTEAGLSRASTTSDIVVVNPPIAGAPISPKPLLNYGVGLSIGLLLPLLVFVILEVLNNRIQSRDDIEKITSVPVIGGIGHNPEINQLVIVEKPRSIMAESFRAVRSNLNYFTSNKEKQVFMVTSSIPGEGKSFTSLNLACVFALAGKRTILIGADLRRPKLYQELGLENSLGLSQYLSSMAALDQVIQTTSVANLSFIPGGQMPPNPSELLIRPAMEEMLTKLKDLFDYIIVDTPPLSLVTDAFVLSQFANHVIFVIRQDYTPRMALTGLEEHYSSGRLKNISILFNDIRKSGLGYGYGINGYGYGYSYPYGNKSNGYAKGYYE